jgi:TPR repeat protein
MDIIERIKNDEEVSVEEVISLDIDIIQELFNDGNDYTIYKKLFDHCITHREIDDSKILCLLGRMYDDGKGVEQNGEEAIKYYKMAIEKGDCHAMNNLGYMYYNGKGVERNYDEAIKYYKMSIEKGNSHAMFNLGLMYQYGDGVEQNYDEAIKYYKMAIEKGDSDAMNNLGHMFHTGFDVEKNFEEAIKYYKMAIEKGDSDAMYNLGIMYHFGEGVEQNVEEAIKYYKMAIEKDFEKAKTNLLALINKINELSTMEKIKYYNILNRCEKTKEYAKKIIIKQETDDIVQMYNIIEEMRQELKELRTHVEYMPDGIGYQEAKTEFETLQQK